MLLLLIRNNHKLTAKKGMTLIEVIVSLAILAVAAIGIGSLVITTAKVHESTRQYASGDLVATNNIEARTAAFDGSTSTTVGGIYAMASMLSNSMYCPGAYCNLVTSGAGVLLADGEDKSGNKLNGKLTIAFAVPEGNTQKVTFSDSTTSITKAYPLAEMESFRINILVGDNSFFNSLSEYPITVSGATEDIPKDLMIRIVNAFGKADSSNSYVGRFVLTDDSQSTKFEQWIYLDKNFINDNYNDTLQSEIVSAGAFNLNLSTIDSKGIVAPKVILNAFELVSFKASTGNDNPGHRLANTNIVIVSNSATLEHATVSIPSGETYPFNINFLLNAAAATQQGISYGGSTDIIARNLNATGIDSSNKNPIWLSQVNVPVIVTGRNIATRSALALQQK